MIENIKVLASCGWFENGNHANFRQHFTSNKSFDMTRIVSFNNTIDSLVCTKSFSRSEHFAFSLFSSNREPVSCCTARKPQS